MFFDVYSNIRSGLRAIQSVLIECSPSQKSFFPSFLTTFPRSQFVVCHFVSSGSSPFSTAHFTANTFTLLLCRLTCCVPTSVLHPDRRRCTVSLCSPPYLHLSHSSNPLIFFHALVSIICSGNANIDDVFLGSVLYFNQPEFSLLYCLGISLSSFFSAKLCCVFLFCPSSRIFFSFFHPSFHSVQLSLPITTFSSSIDTATSAFLIAFSASFFSDICSFWL